MRYLVLAAFLACIPAANWLIGNVGVKCIPNGPCLVPVGFGLLAVLVILGLGGAFFSPRERRLAELAERDLAAGELSEEYQALGVQVARVGALTSLLILVTVLFMVLGARGVFT